MDTIINLDENVLRTLDFFTKNPPPPVDLDNLTFPFVVGSGNAYVTGSILFSGKAAVIADESNFKKIIVSYEDFIKKGIIKDAVIISASGGKDSVWELELAKKYSLHTTLLTTKEESEAAKIADKVYVFESIDEPYTYNVSTYMGMILSKTEENPAEIKNYITSLEFPQNFDAYKTYTFVLPDNYMHVCSMLDIKKSELFGSNLSLRAFSQGHARHAKFVIRSKDELVISIGEKNEYFGNPDSRWDIFPQDYLDVAGIMALTYYIVGKIQAVKPSYFRENISNYVSDYGPKAYSPDAKPFELIVPGSTLT